MQIVIIELESIIRAGIESCVDNAIDVPEGAEHHKNMVADLFSLIDATNERVRNVLWGMFKDGHTPLLVPNAMSLLDIYSDKNIEFALKIVRDGSHVCLIDGAEVMW